MAESTVPAMAAPPRGKDNPLTRSIAGMIGFAVLAALTLACLGTLPWTLSAPEPGAPRAYEAGDLDAFLLPPSWWPLHPERHADEIERYAQATAANDGVRPTFLFGTDKLGRDLLVRCLAGGGVSIGIGLAAATISVLIGTIYGAFAGYVGGRTDAVMMRIVDVLYGLPYILLVVLLAVAGDALIDEWSSRASARDHYAIEHTQRHMEAEGVRPATKAEAERYLEAHPEFSAQLDAEMDAIPRLRPRQLTQFQRKGLEVLILLIAIGGVSWLTMARVIRGQVLSLKEQPFMEAASAMGVPMHAKFLRHLLPNLLGPIIVYATLTVPQAILQESFLSFLGIGVKPPLPSWGNLAADGLVELNTVKVRWWLLLFPCLLLATTLLALNFLGEGLREAFDPKRSRK